MSKFTNNLIALFLLICCSVVLTSANSPKVRRGDKNTVFTCSPESREGDACPEYYRAVCGYRPGVRCFTTPCTHITYPNECFACHDSTVESYTYGECTQND